MDVTHDWLSQDTAPWLNGADMFDEDIRPDQVAAFLGDSCHVMRLAVVDGTRGVGMASGTVVYHPDKPKSLFVNEVGASDAPRRHGIATRLLQDLSEWSNAKCCTSMWFATEHDTDAARGLYRSFSASGETGVVVCEWSVGK